MPSFRSRLGFSLGVVLLLGALSACGSDGGGDSDGDGDGSDGSNGGLALEDAQFGLTFDDVSFASDHGNGTLAAIDGGDVVLAALTGERKLFVARLGPSAEVRWAKTYEGEGDERSPSHIVVEPSRVVVIGSSQGSSDPMHVVSLDPSSGAVLTSRAYTGSCIYPARARALSDGGLVISCSGGEYFRLNVAYDVTWSKLGRSGGDVHVLDDGFAFAGVALSNTSTTPGSPGGASVGTGAALEFVSNEGVSRGWHFMGPGPGTHSLGGIRVLPNGNLMLALGVDSTRSDSPAALSPLVLATFGPDGSPASMSKVTLRVVDPEDGPVPLQFGGAYSVVPRSDETWVGLIATSGAIGSDVRAPIVARFGIDGSPKNAAITGVHAAPTMGGSAMAFTLVTGVLTLHRSSPSTPTCIRRTEILAESITPYLDERSAENSALRDVESVGTERALTPKDVPGTTTSLCASNGALGG